MIDVDLRRYGQDKEYEKFVNNLLRDSERNDILQKRLDGIDFTYEIKRRVREDEDNFIFETIEPYCSNIAQQKISKKDLDEAIQLWMAAKRIMHKEDKP